MKHLSLSVTLSLVAVVSACGGAEQTPVESPDRTVAATDSPDPAMSGATATDAEQACVAAMTKARTCTDEYIPALVDLRISLDLPAGIAQYAQTEGKDAVVAAALEEWNEDSTDASIASTCQSIVPNLPADKLDDIVQTSNDCAAEAACNDFVACIMPLHEEMFKMAASAPAQ